MILLVNNFAGLVLHVTHCTLNFCTGVNIESGSSRNSVREVNTSICQLPGFVSLQWLLEPHCAIAEIYYLLGCLLVNQSVTLPTDTVQVR